MSLDHGLLNLPLAKRGDIDAQLDKHKAAQARDAAAQRKAASKLLAEQRIEAKRIVAAMTPQRMAEIAARCSTTVSEVRGLMKSNAYFQPALVIKTEGARA